MTTQEQLDLPDRFEVMRKSQRIRLENLAAYRDSRGPAVGEREPRAIAGGVRRAERGVYDC